MMREAVALPFDRSTVQECLLDTEADRLFARAWGTSLQAVDSRLRRGRLVHVIGHMAESVGELLWVGLGYNVLWHLTGPGTHGVDLVLLCPAGERLWSLRSRGRSELGGGLGSPRVPPVR